MNNSLVEKIKDWYSVSERIKRDKDVEMALRTEIVSRLKPVLGTFYRNIKSPTDDIKIKAVVRNNLSIIKEGFEEAYYNMTPEEKHCFKFVPKLKPGIEYPDAVKDILISKPAAPTLKIIENTKEEL